MCALKNNKCCSRSLGSCWAEIVCLCRS